MTAGFEVITSTRVARLYGMHPKLYGVVVRGEQSESWQNIFGNFLKKYCQPSNLIPCHFSAYTVDNCHM